MIIHIIIINEYEISQQQNQINTKATHHVCQTFGIDYFQSFIKFIDMSVASGFDISKTLLIFPKPNFFTLPIHPKPLISKATNPY